MSAPTAASTKPVILPGPSDSSKHARELRRQQDSLAATLEKNHKTLEAKITELDAAIKVSQSATAAATATAGKTPLKGGTYEDEIRRLMEDVATGLGDEYVDTSNTAGALALIRRATASWWSTAVLCGSCSR